MRSIETIDNFLKTFQWNTMKYRTDKSLVELAELLNNVRRRFSILRIYSMLLEDLSLLLKAHTNLQLVADTGMFFFIVDSNSIGGRVD